MVDTNSVQQHYVFVGHLSHHTGRFKESLPTIKGALKHDAGLALKLEALLLILIKKKKSNVCIDIYIYICI